MARREVPVSIRRLIVEIDPSTINVTEFCAQHGVSTWFFYDLRRRYAVEGERRTDWLAKGVVKYHRTVATTLNSLIEAGFSIRRVGEFAPSAKQIEDMPALAEELERPMILMISAQR